MNHSAAALLATARYEVIPTASIEALLLAEVTTDRVLTVTASPVKGLDATVELTETLIGHGYRVVPHLSARSVMDEKHLREIVERLVALGVDDVFVPAGDADPPAGKYDGSLPVLEELTALGRPFAHVGITGYPESHPSIGDDVTVQSMWDKRRHATYIVGNLCFDAGTYRAWIRRVRGRGIELPIHIGMAGPVDTTKLLTLATRIGVGPSTRMLTQHGGWFLRFLAPGGYQPDRLLGRLARVAGEPGAGVAGLHVFTFNQVAEVERWRRSTARR